MEPETLALKGEVLDEELPVDLSQLRPIPIRKTLLLINNFVSNTTRFLNHFSAVCEEKLARVANNLTRLEVQLAILETKLNSIPDLNSVSGPADIPEDLPTPGAAGR